MSLAGVETLPPRSYYALVVPGLEDIAATELAGRGANVVETLSRFDKRDSIVRFESADVTRALGCGTIDDVFEVVLDTATPLSPHGARQLARRLQREALERAMLTHHAVRPGKRGRSFNVIARVAGTHPFRREQVEHAFKTTLDAMLARWVPVTTNAALEIWVHIIGDRTIVGLRLSSDTMAQRSYKKAHVPASLKPTVARALVTLADMRAGDVVVDPMCGVGTILREAADALSATDLGRGASRGVVLGGDVDSNALAGSRINAGPGVQLARWDASRLPLRSGSVVAVVTNPPYGRQHEAAAGVDVLYKRSLREVARVLRSGGRAVVLTGEAQTLSEALPRVLRIRTRRRILLRGLPVTAFVIVRE